MRKILVLVLLTTILRFSGCAIESEPSLYNESDDDIYSNIESNGDIEIDIQELNWNWMFRRASFSQTTHTFDDVVKIAFAEYGFSQIEKSVAIDIYNKVFFAHPPSLDRYLDSEEPSSVITDVDIQNIRGLFEKYDVLNWERSYGVEVDQGAEDGGPIWNLFILFTDGKRQLVVGYAENEANLWPENFRDFVNDLTMFTSSKE